MPRIFLDFETYCELSVVDVGVKKHVNHPSFHPWCCAYAIEDGDIRLWRYGEDPSTFYSLIRAPDSVLVAFNAEYELGVLNSPVLLSDITSEKFIDVQALAGMFGYPLNLDKFCKAIGSKELKDKPNGTRLINKLCIQQIPTVYMPDGKWTPETAPEDFIQLYTYCMQDVRAMREAYFKLPLEDLSPIEKLIWRHTLLQNDRGLPIDSSLVNRILQLLTKHNRKLQTELIEITEGRVTTGKQVQRIQKELQRYGVGMTSLSAEAVEYALAVAQELPPVAVRLLELRQALAQSSTAKFKTMKTMEYEGRIHGSLQYYGAHTGRFAGRGVQPHNLPRATLEDPEKTIQEIKSSQYDPPSDFNSIASALIRSCIKSKENFIVGDYSSIENVVLHWLADDKATVEDFRKGIDQYKRYASSRFGVAYADVTSKQRTYAKPNVLGLGYGAGWGALVKVANTYGIRLSAAQAKEEVNFYRYKQYPKIPALWKNIFKTAKRAILTGAPQTLFTGSTKLHFRYTDKYLYIILPSGRRLSYPQARTDDSWNITVKGRSVPMSAEISYMGIKTGQWMRLGMHPGLMTENIVQAISRDILVFGTLCVEQWGYPVLCTIHDEIICETTKTDLEAMLEFMCLRQDWAKDIPIKAAGYVGKRYKKD